MVVGTALVALGLGSCKNEKETKAEKSIETVVVYTDSLDRLDAKVAKENWKSIDSLYEIRIANAEAALQDAKDAKAAQDRIDASKTKYAALKTNIEAQMTAAPDKSAAANPKQQLRNALFGEGKIGDDMNFDWVNKDNIHSVYQQFVHTAENNKDKYSREDWDEVKLMYEALDSRKNTVEKEGLSSSDNLKIAGLKIKFAAMSKVNRMGAKSEEMEKAKK
jgi:hypothetical protein